MKQLNAVSRRVYFCIIFSSFKIHHLLAAVFVSFFSLLSVAFDFITVYIDSNALNCRHRNQNQWIALEIARDLLRLLSNRPIAMSTNGSRTFFFRSGKISIGYWMVLSAESRIASSFHLTADMIAVSIMVIEFLRLPSYITGARCPVPSAR